MSSSSIAKAWFVISVGLLGVVYGTVSNQWNMFPTPQMRTAWNQAQVWFGLESPGTSWSRSYDREGVRVLEPDKVQSGLRFVATTWEAGAGEPSLTLMDEEGTVVHEWTINRKEIFPNARENLERAELHGSVLLPNGDVLFNLDYVGTARLDACGNVQWRLTEKNHHSIARGENGTFWIPGVRRGDNAQSYPGLENPWADRILHVSGEGEILDDISVLDILYQNDLERYIAKARATNLGDVTHLNDVEPLRSSMADEYPTFEAGDLVVSLKRLDLVFVFDPESLEVKWHVREPFIGQHDPDFTGDGWIGLFDNNIDGTKEGTMLGGSRIVSFQPHTDSTKVRFPTSNSDLFYTQTQGKWQELENGNMLLAETAAGRVVEVDPEGNSVWEFVEPGASLTKASLHDLSKEDVSRWPCTSVDASRN
jgi:hypothetical protein